MQESIYFVFNLEQKCYGIEKEYIEEVFLLPEFTLTPEAPYPLIGVVDLRGVNLPLIDIRFRSDRSKSDRSKSDRPLYDYQLTDRVLVLRFSQFRIGIVVNKIQEEITVASESFYQVSEEQFTVDEVPSSAVAGHISSPEPILLLKRPENWLEEQAIAAILHATNLDEVELDEMERGSSIASLIDENTSLISSSAEIAEPPVFAQNATEQEREIFRERADRLRQSLQKQEPEVVKPVAVVAISEQIWGVDLEFVREFLDIRSLTPIPCCPRHIIGNTNYRGEVLTLIDIRQALGFPFPETLDSLKAIVVETEDGTAGILVDKVYDALFLPESRHEAEENGVKAEMTMLLSSRFVQRTALYGTGRIGILNLPKLFLAAELQVDEAL